MSKKIAIGLSGGVDSNTSAYLLKKAGANLTAVYFRFYARNRAEAERLRLEEKNAQRIATQLAIPFKSLDFSALQEKEVVNYFLAAYRQGKSPNPCIVCNQLLKFGEFYDWALAEGFDAVASGHYAQIIEKNGQSYLASAHDQQKDQSYFLYQLREEQLKKIIFPLGSMLKSQVRQLAQKEGLITAKKKESFDICFLHGSSPKEFLSEKIGQKTGNLVDQNGTVIGQHQGAHLYTIGQRQGFKIDHQLLKTSSIDFDPNHPPALFVIAKNIAKNQVVLGLRQDCFSQEFQVKNLHLINQQFASKNRWSAWVKVRNSGKLIACQIERQPDQESRATVKTKEKIFALTAGQAAVFYLNFAEQKIILGGGEITI